MIQFCKAYRKEPEDISEMEFARSKSGHDKNQIYLIKICISGKRNDPYPGYAKEKKCKAYSDYQESTDRSYGDFGRKLIRSYSKKSNQTVLPNE
jgi:hypothetical protein